jgi:hypothetical protein
MIAVRRLLQRGLDGLEIEARAPNVLGASDDDLASPTSARAHDPARPRRR